MLILDTRIVIDPGIFLGRALGGLLIVRRIGCSSNRVNCAASNVVDLGREWSVRFCIY